MRHVVLPIWSASSAGGARLARIALPAALLLPVCVGVAATLLPAFGFEPALGGHTLSLAPMRTLFAWPGFASSLARTVRTGILGALLALATAVPLGFACRRRGAARLVQALSVPLLAVPHAAVAVGLAFLLAPSGWVVRLASPWLTGWRTPPDIATVQDPFGLALIAGLWVKETPFLTLVILAALGQAEPGRSERVAASLGYRAWRGWLLAVWPRVWPQIRLPTLAVLAFSLAVADQAVVLGPDDPPTLAVQILRWYTDPDLSRWFEASAAAVLLGGLVAAGLAATLLTARAIGWLGRRAAASGHRGRAGGDVFPLAAVMPALLGLASLAVLALWAGAGFWRFPDPLPDQWSLSNLVARTGDVAVAAGTTLWLGVATTLLALVLAVGWFEAGAGVAAAFLPLLVPQPAFLFGLQLLLLRARLDGTAAGLILAHLLLVLPYVLLTLAEPWRALDARHVRAAAALGASPLRVLVRVRLPLLTRPLAVAAAVGFAVSAGLYLPTIFAGNGRYATLATEAVARASGADRRTAAAAALALAALPLAGYALTLLAPRRAA